MCCEKGLVDLLQSQDVQPANDAETIFLNQKGSSVLVCAWFVNNVFHLMTDAGLFQDVHKYLAGHSLKLNQMVMLGLLWPTS